MMFPFSRSTIEQDMVGKKMVVYGNVLADPTCELLNVIEFEEDGETSSGYQWETTDGILRILSEEHSLVYSFNGLDVVNGVVRAVGETPVQKRVIMCEEKTLGVGCWGVRISSHVRYKDASDKILKSLKMANFDMNRVIVVVGGSKDDVMDYHDDDGVTFIHTPDEKGGYVSLSCSGISGAFDYCVCLHDTCDIFPNFEERISEINVSLKPDIVTLCPPLGFEIGLFREEFIDDIEIPKIDITQMSSFLTESSNVFVSLSCVMHKSLGFRDVYGSGNQREELVVPIVGIKKYRGRDAAGGKP